MVLDEHEQRRARQDLLEAMSASLSGPVCAPMPGTILEMLEIAAMERRHRNGAATTAKVAKPPLTASSNGGRMQFNMLRISKAFADVARRLGSGLVTGRLPV